jgi:hypothetical protein
MRNKQDTVLWTHRPPWGPAPQDTTNPGSKALTLDPRNTLSEREI